MFSLNVPVPGDISAQAWDLRSQLLSFDQLRDEHTLVVKRFSFDSGIELDSEIPRIRETLQGVDPFTVKTTGIGSFRHPPAGPAPVLYFAVESPAIFRIHDRFVDAYGAVPVLEGEGYTPHITLARGGGSVDIIEQLDPAPHTWTVEHLLVWDAKRALPAARIPLPA